MSNFFSVYEEQGLSYFQLPKVFFSSEKYMNMSIEAKVTWAILKDRFQISIKNQWYDESGYIYFIYTNDDLRKILNIGSRNKIVKVKNELIEADLLYQVRIGVQKPNKLYIKKPVATDNDVYEINKTEPETVDKTVKYQNHTSRSIKNTPQEVSKSYSSKTDLSKTDLSKNNLKDQSFNENINSLNLPDDIKATLNNYQKRLIDDDISLMDIESNYKAHRELLTVGEYQSALNFVLAKFERPIASIEAAMRTAVTKKLELREKAHQSNQPKQDTMPKWFKDDQETAAINADELTPVEDQDDSNLGEEQARFQRMLEQRRKRRSENQAL